MQSFSFRLLAAAAVCASAPVAASGNETIREEQRIDRTTSSGSTDSSHPVITSVEDVVVAVWAEDNVGASTKSNIFASVSDVVPAGGKFRFPVRISLDGARDEIEPTVAMFEDKIFIAWRKETAPGLYDVFASVSHFCSVTKKIIRGQPQKISDTADSGSARNLQVRICGDEPETVLIVAWEDDTNDPGSNHDVYAAASQDCGETFGTPVRINTGVTAGSADSHGLTLAIPIPEEEDEDHGHGGESVEPECCATAYLGWLDDRNGGDHAFFARTVDGGLNWVAKGQIDGAANLDDVDGLSMAALECDTEGLVFFAWTDNRNETGESSAYRPRMRTGTESGDILSAEQVTLPDVTPINVDAHGLQLATSHLEEVWLSWRQTDTGTEDDIYLIGGLYDLNADGLVAYRPSSPASLPYDDVSVNASDSGSFSGEDNAKLAHRLSLSEGAVQVTFLYDEASTGLTHVYMSFLDLLITPAYQMLEVTTALSGSDLVDAVSANLGDHDPWESHVIWTDDRNGQRDVFVSGLNRDHPVEFFDNFLTEEEFFFVPGGFGCDP